MQAIVGMAGVWDLWKVCICASLLANSSTWVKLEKKEVKKLKKMTLRNPPQRPTHKNFNWFEKTKANTDRDNFMMDFENYCANDLFRKFPKGGPRRLENKKWAAFMKTQVYPHHSDVDWDEYVAWVKAGGGDEYFFEDGECCLGCPETCDDDIDFSDTDSGSDVSVVSLEDLGLDSDGEVAF